MAIQVTPDVGTLQHEVQLKYTELAENPDLTYHFHHGRPRYSFADPDLYRHHRLVLGAGVSEGAQDHSLLETRLAELLEERTAFLGAGHSSKPIRGSGLYFFRKGLPQDELCSIHATPRLHNPGKLAKYPGPFRVEVEYPIGQRHIHGIIFYRQLFGVC